MGVVTSDKAASFVSKINNYLGNLIKSAEKKMGIANSDKKVHIFSKTEGFYNNIKDDLYLFILILYF
jgi:hypothetical protein